MAEDDPIRALVVDDLGKEHRTVSGWAENCFERVIRNRVDRGLPTIITTIVPPRDWKDIYGAPMASFANEALTPLRIGALVGDRRMAS